MGRLRQMCRETENNLRTVSASVGKANRHERNQFVVKYQLAMGQVAAAVSAQHAIQEELQARLKELENFLAPVDPREPCVRCRNKPRDLQIATLSLKKWKHLNEDIKKSRVAA